MFVKTAHLETASKLEGDFNHLAATARMVQQPAVLLGDLEV